MARFFNAGTEGINIGAPAALPTNFPITLSAWIYPTSATVDGVVFGFLKTAAEQMELRHDRGASGFICVAVSTATPSNIVANSTTTCAAVVNTWVHVAGVYDGTNLGIWINGSRQANPAASGNLVTGSGSKWGIGRDFANSGNSFKGNIADAAVWNVVLLGNEIASLAKGIRPYNIRKASLAGYWPVDGLQSPEPDLSGNASPGTLSGTALANGPPINMFTPRWPMNQLPSGAAPAAATTYAMDQVGAHITRKIVNLGY